MMGTQESWEREGWEIGCKIGEYEWTEKKRKGQDSKNRGAGRVGFLVKEYLCNIVEMIKATKLHENICDKGTRGARSEMVLLRKHLYASRVKEYGKRDPEEVRRGRSRCRQV